MIRDLAKELLSERVTRRRARYAALEALVPSEAYIAFGRCAQRPDANLSPSGDLVEAAANLFAVLHALDAVHDRIAIAPIPATGLGEAINDRLRRAAS